VQCNIPVEKSEWFCSDVLQRNGFGGLGQRFPNFLTRRALFRINFYGGAPCLPFVLQVNGV